jgi:hypothetical protein
VTPATCYNHLHPITPPPFAAAPSHADGLAAYSAGNFTKVGVVGVVGVWVWEVCVVGVWVW